jgi:hypothetical protein
MIDGGFYLKKLHPQLETMALQLDAKWQPAFLKVLEPLKKQGGSITAKDGFELLCSIYNEFLAQVKVTRDFYAQRQVNVIEWLKPPP